MHLFTNNVFNPLAFDAELRQATRDLNAILAAAAATGSAVVESTHILMAVAKVPAGLTRKYLANFGITPDQWESGLSACAAGSTNPPPRQLTEACLHPSAREALRGAERHAQESRLPRITEAVLLLAALENVTEPVKSLCSDTDIDINGWCAELAEAIEPVVALDPFDRSRQPPSLTLALFSPGGRKVIGLTRTEAESLGYDKAEPRHLLLGLLEYEGGATHYALNKQGRLPRKIQEAAVLSLRGKARRTRTDVPLDADHMQPLLQRLLAAAGDAAGRDHSAAIAETHLLRGLLQVESSARRLLEDEKVDLAGLRQTAEQFDVADERDEDAIVMADINTVRQRLLARLVGQQEAIDRILPYIQRMRFGFSVADRPVGVFLFCGQSGSGKTEMAKELARAVYGSESNLIFLEMGQFNVPESMTIFVGAPPGYIGYGEGKLTNGLRDKPQAVVLFDEVEKAHSRVLDALLRFVDEGKIDDPAGPVRDGSRCLLVLTSNVWSEELGKLWGQAKTNPNWRAEVRRQLREAFRKHSFRVEFLNRLDEVILFRTLEEADYTEIARRLLASLLELLKAQRGIDVTLEKGVAAAIGGYCAAIEEGARAVRRLVQSVVLTPVIDYVMREGCIPPVYLAVAAVRATNDPDCEPAGSVSRAKPPADPHGSVGREKVGW